MLGPWRCHWTQTAHSAQSGGEFCSHSTGPMRSKHFQQKESYFHILHVNWDWMDYVTSVELFIDLKPRICEVWVTFMIVISSVLLTLLVNYICHDQEKSKKGTYKKGGSIKEIQMMSLYPPFLYVPFLELFFQVTYSLSKFFWLWCRHSLCPKCPMVQKKVVHREDICWHLFQ